jgi:hypothetical protein
MSLADKLKWTGKGVNPMKPKTPVWGGPELRRASRFLF